MKSDESIEARITIEVDNEELARKLCDILKPEIEVDMGGATGYLSHKGNYLVAIIRAHSYSGFRASINAFIRLLTMVINVINTLKE